MSETNPPQEETKEISKAQLKKQQKEAEKAAKKAETAQKVQAQPTFEIPKLTFADVKTALYGDLPLHQSQQEFSGKQNYVFLDEITQEQDEVVIRAYAHNVRATGKGAFVVVRQKTNTMQCVFFGDKLFVKYINSLPKESYIEIHGNIKKPEQPIINCSIQNLELQISKIFCLSRAAAVLPLQVEDAARPDSAFLKENQFVNPGRDTRLDHRVMDLRTPANQAIFYVRMAIQQQFMQFLNQKQFLQITTPKLIGGASEGGASVFHVQYFDKPACLAQSPQLYKQMCISAGFQKVYEVGAVYRAEQSNTHRHLCEFTGMDIETEILDSYEEVILLLDQLMKHIFGYVLSNCAKQIQIIRTQYDLKMPAPLVWTEKPVIIDFRDGVKWLNDTSIQQNILEDLSTESEKALGKIVKERFNTDFYTLNKFPAAARPFYSMPDFLDENYSNAFDVFIRGQEVCSGSQRVHDCAKLLEMLEKKEINNETLQDYINAFKYGCPPHAGAGLGLERVVMLLLGIEDCRQCCLFPRTPERLSP